MPNTDEPSTPGPTTLPGPKPRRLEPGFGHVVLVCKACQKRGGGPKKLKARDAAKLLARAWRDAKLPRARLVLTGCLGACPKKAFTVVASAPAGGVAMIAFRRGDDAAEAVQTLSAG